MGSSDMTEAITPRVKSVENMIDRAKVTTGDPRNPACPVCHAKMWMGVFFDGTGNHREHDFPLKHSNVAALHDAHINDPDAGIVALYYEGLGREFEFKDRYEKVPVATRAGVFMVEQKGYRESDDRLIGKAFANGISARLEKALFDLINRIQLMRAQQRVDEINIAVFGFSRGATEARAFLHWLAAHSKVKPVGKNLSFDGVPMNIKFLGLFDTVESVGMAGENKLPDLIKTKVPSFVQKCTHIVAAHELRAAFPLTVVNGAHKCVAYPGAHADVGGGYRDGEQGRSSQLARMALLQMLDEARGAGLKMRSVGEMKASPIWTTAFKPSFDVSSEARGVLSKYMKEVDPKGSLGQHMQAHMARYWAWIDSGKAIQDVEAKLKALSKQTERQAELQRMHHLLKFLPRTQAGRGQGAGKAVDISVSDACSKLFSGYVHDSFEHFSATGGTLQTDGSTADYYQLRELHLPVG
jgi:uncharacterized protein (DUF2235 family)